MLIKNVLIAIFDEPTANLDSTTERDLVQALFTGLNDKTILWITHRLVGMHHMDEIFVMSGGKIVERGRHSELLTLGGIYKRMWDLQNQEI